MLKENTHRRKRNVKKRERNFVVFHSSLFLFLFLFLFLSFTYTHTHTHTHTVSISSSRLFATAIITRPHVCYHGPPRHPLQPHTLAFVSLSPFPFASRRLGKLMDGIRERRVRTARMAPLNWQRREVEESKGRNERRLTA